MQLTIDIVIAVVAVDVAGIVAIVIAGVVTVELFFFALSNNPTHKHMKK